MKVGYREINTKTQSIMNYTSNHRMNLFFLVLIVTATLLVYGGSLRYFFWQEDFNLLYLVRNGSIIDYISLSFSKHTERIPLNLGILFRPIPHYVYFDVINDFFGLNPIPYRITNFIIVIINSILVYFCAVMFSGKKSLGYIASLLFVINRVLYSPMYWISSNNETILTLFALISLASYLRATDRQDNRNLFLFISYISIACALLTKETAVVIPILIIIFILFRAGSQTFRARLVSCFGLWPHFMIAVIFVAIRAPFILHALGGGSGSYYTTSKYASIPIHYLWGIWWNLETFVEPWRTILNGITRTYSLFQPVYIALLCLIGAIFIVGWSIRHETDWFTGRAVLAGIVWFVGASLPPLSTGILVDYIFVLPSVGFVLAVATVLDLLRSRIAGWNTAIANTFLASILILSVASSALLIRTLEQTTWPASHMTLTVQTLASLREYRSLWNSNKEICVKGIPNDHWWGGSLEPAARLFVNEHLRIIEMPDNENNSTHCPDGVPVVTYYNGVLLPPYTTRDPTVTVNGKP